MDLSTCEVGVSKAASSLPALVSISISVYVYLHLYTLIYTCIILAKKYSKHYPFKSVHPMTLFPDLPLFAFLAEVESDCTRSKP